MSEQTIGQGVTRPIYQDGFERHYNALLGMFRHLITQFADEAVEIAARGVALAAPLPNAISMYNISQKDLGWHWVAALSFAISLEIVVFLLVEIALIMWDGYLTNQRRYKAPFFGMIGVVIIAVLVVMGFVFWLEPHKIMAALPIISLCSFIGIGLKRWHERGIIITVQSAIVPEVRKAEQPANDAANERRKQVATYYKDNPTASYQTAADALSITSKATVYNDLKWLEKQDVLHVHRNGKTTNVEVNGRYEYFVNG
jgi:hypothetical protein